MINRLNNVLMMIRNSDDDSDVDRLCQSNELALESAQLSRPTNVGEI